MIGFPKKTCKRGHNLKDVGAYKVGKYWSCRNCTYARTKKYRNDPATNEKRRIINRKHDLLKQFQLTVGDWEKIYEYQKGKCAICGKELRHLLKKTGTGGATAALDHCHKTGKIRGLLCQFPCNRFLGFLRDNSDLFRASADYLDSPPATIAFGGERLTLPGRAYTKKRNKEIAKLSKI